jgi:hypothetical protein
VELKASTFEASCGFTGRVLSVFLGSHAVDCPVKALRDLSPPAMKEVLRAGTRDDTAPVVGLSIAVDVTDRGRRGAGQKADLASIFEFLLKALAPCGPGIASGSVGKPSGPVRMVVSKVDADNAIRVELVLDQTGCCLNGMGTLGELRTANLRTVLGRYFTLVDPSGKGFRMGEVNARMRREVKRAFGQ